MSCCCPKLIFTPFFFSHTLQILPHFTIACVSLENLQLLRFISLCKRCFSSAPTFKATISLGKSSKKERIFYGQADRKHYMTVWCALSFGTYSYLTLLAMNFHWLTFAQLHCYISMLISMFSFFNHTPALRGLPITLLF